MDDDTANLPERIEAGLTAAEAIAQTPGLLNQALDFWRENSRMNMQLQAMGMMQQVQITRMTQRYALVRDMLTAIFAERGTALAAHYRSLDHALACGDREMVLASLRGISGIVSQNPLESFRDFAAVLDDPSQTLQLDF